MEAIKRLPIGISDFKTLRRSNKYFIDKTMYLPKMEDVSDFLFLIRPRRFGKSLFLSMVADYYDCENSNIDEEFEGTWIANNPLSSRGQFQILQYDFSLVLNRIGNLENDFNTYCCNQLDSFIYKYEKYYNKETVHRVLEEKAAKEKINIISKEAKERDYHLYLIIDEYDNFTNTVLNELGEDTYHNMTHSSGFYRNVFKIFKPNFERILFMGISPITLNDLTSGFNIATNISLHPWFHQMLGFSEDEVRQMIAYYQVAGLIPSSKQIDGETRINEIISEMKPWYDNYCFAEDCYATAPRMFNSNMVLYYLNNLITTGKAPKEMADPSCRTDYAKLKNLVRLDQLDGNRKSIVTEIASKGFINAQLADSFAAEEVMSPDRFVSLLYYYGMLTIGGTELDTLHLVIPNNTIRKLYYDFLLEQYQKENWIDLNALNEKLKSAALDGDGISLFQYLAEAYKKDSSIRDGIEGERNIQGYMNAYLHLSKLFITKSEVEASHGYCDFFLLADTRTYPSLQHSYIIELKYLKANATTEEIKAAKSDAKSQLSRYKTDTILQKLAASTKLHGISMVFINGKNAEVEEI